MTKKKPAKKKTTKKQAAERKANRKKLTHKGKPLIGELLAGPGQPTKYDARLNYVVYKLCLLGTTDAQLSDFFGITESTLNLWKLEHPKFSESIKKGKLIADADVAESLLHRAKGYSHPEQKVFCSDGEITTHETTKHYPPDTAAAIIWLKNRAPDRWREKKEIEVTQVPLTELSLDDLSRLRQRLERERLALTGETTQE